MAKKRQQAAQKVDAPAADSVAPQYPIESVDNALKLLLLGEQPQIRLSEATRYLGVASSTAHRLLAMLTYRGFVRQDPVSKAYLPGPALTSVAFAIFGRIDWCWRCIAVEARQRQSKLIQVGIGQFPFLVKLIQRSIRRQSPHFD